MTDFNQKVIALNDCVEYLLTSNPSQYDALVFYMSYRDTFQYCPVDFIIEIGGIKIPVKSSVIDAFSELDALNYYDVQFDYSRQATEQEIEFYNSFTVDSL